MAKPLKLHWASSKPNFGDWLSPAICEHLSGREVQHASITKCDLVAVGSLMQRVKENFWNKPIHIWGTGFIEDLPPHKSRHTIHALRGTQSASLITNKEVECLGDPGLLVDQVYSLSAPRRDFTLGVIPHYKDHDRPEIQGLSANINSSLIVNVMAPPKEVIASILRCDFIVSSSLHGLVVADSFGIPNTWLQMSEHVRGGGWKFRDYYSAFGITDANPLTISESLPSLQDILSHIGDYHRPGIDLVKESLIKSFPFPKPRQI